MKAQARDVKWISADGKPNLSMLTVHEIEKIVRLFPDEGWQLSDERLEALIRQIDHLVMFYMMTPPPDRLKQHALPELRRLFDRTYPPVKLVYAVEGVETRSSEFEITEGELAKAYRELASAAAAFSQAHDDGLLRLKPELKLPDGTLDQIDGIAKYCAGQADKWQSRSVARADNLLPQLGRLSIFIEGMILVWREAGGAITAGGGPLMQFLRIGTDKILTEPPTDDQIRNWIRTFQKKYQTGSSK